MKLASKCRHVSGEIRLKIEGMHEKELFEQKFPFRLIVNQDPRFKYPSHWHSAIELIYVLRNPFTVLVNSKHYELKEKDILYIPGGDIHGFSCETAGTRIFINFELTSLNSYSGMDRIYTHLRSVQQIPAGDEGIYPKVKAELQKILEAEKTGGIADELFYTARIIDILALLCRSTPAQVNIDTLKSDKDRNAGLDKISKSFEYVEKNYMEDIHLKDIASAAGFSEYYFSRLFKEITEKNFRRYLNEYRIKKAEALLIVPNCTISEVAYAVGFSSITSFDRLFREIKGCSPQDFRKLHVGI